MKGNRQRRAVQRFALPVFLDRMLGKALARAGGNARVGAQC